MIPVLKCMKTVSHRRAQRAQRELTTSVFCGDLCGYSFLYPPLMPKRELQEIPHLFPADAIGCHERVDRILNIARREYPRPADSRRVEGLRAERRQRGPHPSGQRHGERMLGPIYKLWRDILVQYFSEDILGGSAVVLASSRQSQRVFYQFVIQQRLTRLQPDRHACAVYLDQKIVWERCLRVG